jgi:hypothetical protein
MRVGLTPAYGRDYKSKAAIEVDLKSNKDFLISDMSHPACGKPATLEDLKKDGVTDLTVRYGQLRKVTTFKVSKL